MHNRFSFDELLMLSKRSQGRLKIDPCIPDGNVETYHIEKGVRASIWNCRIEEHIELFNCKEHDNDAEYFTLAYFQNTSSLKFANRDNVSPSNVQWDYALFSCVSDYSIRFSPGLHITCLTIYFSKRWLQHTLNNNQTLEEFLSTLITSPAIFITGITTSEQKKHIDAFVSNPANTALGVFHVKCQVLKILTDLLYNLKDGCNIWSDRPADIVSEIEQELCKSVGNKPPDIKSLASLSKISESTLKRKFKKRFGLTMSAYYLRKKMEYAASLMQEHMSLSKVAAMVGYRSVRKFSSMYRKMMKAGGG